MGALCRKEKRSVAAKGVALAWDYQCTLRCARSGPSFRAANLSPRCTLDTRCSCWDGRQGNSEKGSKSELNRHLPKGPARWHAPPQSPRQLLRFHSSGGSSSIDVRMRSHAMKCKSFLQHGAHTCKQTLFQTGQTPWPPHRGNALQHIKAEREAGMQHSRPAGARAHPCSPPTSQRPSILATLSGSTGSCC